MSANILITGCNRGIGLELVKQYLKTNPKHLIATTRQDSKELNDLAKVNTNLHILVLDVAEINSFEAFSAKVGEILGSEGLNLLINNAAILTNGNDPTLEEMRQSFEVNCLGPLFLTKALLPHIKAAAANKNSAKIVMISSSVGSIAENERGGLTAYRTSKAALNMVMKNLSIELKGDGVIVMAMHPGWVQTDLGGPNALITTETCCVGMLKTLEELTEKDNGTFLRYNNTPIQW